MSIDMRLVEAILNATPGWDAQLAEAGLDATDVSQILTEAARLAETTVAPLAGIADREHCKVVEGRVKTPAGYAEAYRALGENGWITADLSPEFGGMGLPLALNAAVILPFEAAAQPFMMASGSTRAGAHLLADRAPDLAADWCPKASEGKWTITICISEPDAGSDVGRIRTKAVQDGDTWRIDGTKCWISFGDHDMADRIGHLCLARTGTPEEGSRGLSLFLVPNDQGIFVERIEEKLGLNGSPTCVLRFEGAKGHLIGEPGRGLSQLFTMIELMRLQVGGQGAGIALACAGLARAYAADRKQGGKPSAPPVPIDTHPDVQRMLTALDAQAMLSTALVLEAAATVQAGHGDAAMSAYAAFLLPLTKTFNGEGACEAAYTAVQVLGGAGYTQEWPAERYYRDARILTIYEGTTGMQGQDFLMRRLGKDQGAGLAVLAGRIRAGEDSLALRLLDRFEALVADVLAQDMGVQMAAADAVLRAGWVLTSAYLAARLTGVPGCAEAMRFWQATLEAKMGLYEAEVARALK
ncbi:acyl-CoA dehydrogenase family protein [Tropicibacter alexandrii]|uniref:acyl-CoA dehydrogenase family protein n=1 Tax=Tropicibacter alexandrii TaxID=2267683 RepID=UPI000EF4B0E0|nr:acyl-CoA dehydrogenase family protein [Tropicibacter alexandrii]